MKKIILNSFWVSISLLLMTACGSNTKPDGGDLSPSQSGTSLSISCYAGGGESSDGGETVDTGTSTGTIRGIATCVVHTIDGDGQPISGVTYTPSVVVNVKASSLHIGSGNILSTEPITFTDNTINFSVAKVQVNDKLIILPNPSAGTTDPSYLGNWKVREVSGSTLTLDSIAYNLETTEDLRYVVGNETLYGDFGSGSVHIEFPREQPIEDNAKGVFVFYLVYDPALANIPVYIGASTSGNRAGAAVAYIIPDENATSP